MKFSLQWCCSNTLCTGAGQQTLFFLCLININLTDSDSLKKELQFVNNTNLKQRHLNLIRTPIQDVNLPYKLLSVFIVVF